MEAIYFKPRDINKKYCEVGMFLDSDPGYIHYLDEPCKIHVSEVEIIDKSRVIYNKKERIFYDKDYTKTKS